jgi:hypothetical protein
MADSAHDLFALPPTSATNVGLADVELSANRN